jgi:FAD/FMN-containing dehydrogenase
VTPDGQSEPDVEALSADNLVKLIVPAHEPVGALVPAGVVLRSWGNQPRPGVERRGEDLVALTAGSVLSRGLGRSYGDSSFPPADDPVATGTALADRILGFDPATGVLRAEAGLSLVDLVYTMLPQGWFTPVTPGTWYVTLGGMVASDVHGKNHHSDGCFGEHVTSLRLRLGDGSVVDCSETERSDLFFATIGGMGLTGHILEVSVRMRAVPSPWILQETIRIRSTEDFLEKMHRAHDRGLDGLLLPRQGRGARAAHLRALGDRRRGPGARSAPISSHHAAQVGSELVAQSAHGAPRVHGALPPDREKPTFCGAS